MTQSATADERVRRVGTLRSWLTRPELAAIAGSILVFVFFAVVAGDSGFLTLGGTASYLEVAAQLGIVAVPDLVIWTGLPSFIVTLAMLFALRGLTIGFSRLLTGRTQIGLSDAISGSPLKPLFAGTFGSFSVSIIWWLGLAVLATWVLQRTVFGNWIFAAGGDPNAARNVGVPVNRVKIILFMCTALSAALLATIQVLDAGSADVLRGELLELQAIAASVIGGVLLTGGYGSVVGALFGALIFGMVQQGIFFIGVSTDWFLVFVGVMLLIAVVFNNIIRKRASEAR
jgi:simple sugar transport system permease protein